MRGISWPHLALLLEVLKERFAYSKTFLVALLIYGIVESVL